MSEAHALSSKDFGSNDEVVAVHWNSVQVNPWAKVKHVPHSHITHIKDHVPLIEFI